MEIRIGGIGLNERVPSLTLPKGEGMISGLRFTIKISNPPQEGLQEDISTKAKYAKRNQIRHCEKRNYLFNRLSILDGLHRFSQ